MPKRDFNRKVVTQLLDDIDQNASDQLSVSTANQQGLTDSSCPQAPEHLEVLEAPEDHVDHKDPEDPEDPNEDMINKFIDSMMQPGSALHYVFDDSDADEVFEDALAEPAPELEKECNDNAKLSLKVELFLFPNF
jgi:hypothetical protein